MHALHTLFWIVKRSGSGVVELSEQTSMVVLPVLRKCERMRGSC